MRNDAPARLLDRLNYRVVIPGQDGTQVDNLYRDAGCLRAGLSHANLPQLHAIANDSHVGALLHDLRLAQGNLIIFEWHVFLGNSI
jgi:hypothetical protein